MIRRPLRGLSLEFNPSDLWVGLFTTRKGPERHVWVCPLPCVAVHFWWVS